MAITSRNVAVTQTATPITNLDTDDQYGYTLLVYNTDTAGNHLVYIGGADVTSANGYPVPAGAIVPAMQLKRSESLYVVTDHTTAVNIRVLALNA